MSALTVRQPQGQYGHILQATQLLLHRHYRQCHLAVIDLTREADEFPVWGFDTKKYG